MATKRPRIEDDSLIRVMSLAWWTMATKRQGVASGEDEPLFVLRAQDVLAAKVVRYWAALAATGSTSSDSVKLEEKTSFGLPAILEGLKPLGVLFCGWAFGSIMKKE